MDSGRGVNRHNNNKGHQHHPSQVVLCGRGNQSASGRFTFIFPLLHHTPPPSFAYDCDTNHCTPSRTIHCSELTPNAIAFPSSTSSPALPEWTMNHPAHLTIEFGARFVSLFFLLFSTSSATLVILLHLIISRVFQQLLCMSSVSEESCADAV